jgi:hypothetical protein
MPLKDACWEGYEAYGFKIKNGRKVPNCVPIKKSFSPLGDDNKKLKGKSILQDSKSKK